jgi:LAS superfamily LD-carboxypeptidase LdcB
VQGIMIANKTYALPATYNPGLQKAAQDAFNEMQTAAAKEKLQLTICSGFRSYSTQKALYDKYVNRDGKAAADRYSARPGHSEHQTGLAMDINMASSKFDNTPEAKWLAENCWKYGFIIRYPQGKENITGYMYESWHVRWLGKDLAKKFYDSGLTLEEYLNIDSVYAAN